MKEMMLQTMQAMLDFVQNTATFVAGQIPLYVTELLKIHAITYGIDAVIQLAIFLLITAVCVWASVFFIRLLKYKWDADDNLDDTMIKTGISILFVLLVWGAIFCGWAVNGHFMAAKRDLIQILKIREAPRVYIIEYLRDQLREATKPPAGN